MFLKTPQRAKVAPVALAGFCDGALLTVLALVWPHSGNAYFAPAYQVVSGALRAELMRRWANRGAPIEITLPGSLPPTSIQMALHFFTTVRRSLEASGNSTAGMEAAGEAVPENTQMFFDATALCAGICDALAHVRVEVGVSENTKG